MGLTISARFVLGTYQGRSPTGAPEAFPETDRLFAAFTAAAGASPLAVLEQGQLRISERHRRALEWLSSSPPDSVSIPGHRFNTPNVTAYRRSGLNGRSGYAAPAARDAVSRSSFAGPLAWRWKEAPPVEITQALDELAGEVAYLGEANSPVVVTLGADDAPLPSELIKVPEDELFPLAAVPVSTPRPGRLRVLEAAHRERWPTKPPKDGKPAKEESELQSPRPGDAVDLVWYRTPAYSHAASTAPWADAIVLEVASLEAGTAWPPEASQLVPWAVALHRTLARVLSPDAPPMVTGRYGDGVAMPANRLAIHLITRHDPLGFTLSRGVDAAFVLLLPVDASAQDLDAVVRATQLVTGRSIHRGRHGSVTITRTRFVPGNEFWRPVPDGHVRWWAPRPLAIAETRPQRKRDGRPWGIEDALRLAVGMVWRDRLGVIGAGSTLYQDLLEAVRNRVHVITPRQIVGQDLHAFVHRVSDSNVLTGLVGMIHLEGLGDARAPTAIGQSRHLGAGLLVPVDIPRPRLDQEADAP